MPIHALESSLYVLEWELFVPTYNNPILDHGTLNLGRNTLATPFNEATVPNDLLPNTITFAMEFCSQ